jgi:hypothetical protein
VGGKRPGCRAISLAVYHEGVALGRLPLAFVLLGGAVAAAVVLVCYGVDPSLALLLPVVVALGAIWAWTNVDERYRQRVLSKQCLGCGYDRQGLGINAACPECGLAP